MFAKVSGLFGVLKPLDGFTGWLIRLPFAVVFLFHGITKFANGIDGFATFLSSNGVSALSLQVAILVAVAEILVGIGILIGTFLKNDMGDAATHLAGLVATPVMIAAIMMVHWPRWNFTPAMPDHPVGGMEFQIVLLCLALYFMIRGNEA